MAANVSQKFKVSLARFSEILNESEIQTIQDIQDQPLPQGIRLNALKGDPESAMQDLASRYGWQVKPIPFCDHGWTIDSFIHTPGTTIEHRMGQYYLQDAASIVPVSLFDMYTPHPLILDMAASPGGKTTHLIDRSQDRGFVLANDASKTRIPALRSVLNTWGGINQAITQFPGEAFGNWFPEIFDIILLDAPCSMENLRPTPNHPMRETTQDERLRLGERQVQLLTSGLGALKIGGQLVYATCSLAPEEDEAVIHRVMEKFPNAFYLQDVSEKMPFKTPGLSEFSDQIYHPDLKKALRLWPHITGMSGFFCALIMKTTPLPHQTVIPPSRDFSKTFLVETDQNVKNHLFDLILEHYGLMMTEIIEAHRLALFTRHNQYFLIPEVYLMHFQSLPYAYIGMLLGCWQDDRFEPSHEFITRFGHTFKKGKICLEKPDVQRWVAGHDIRFPDATLPARGQYLLVTDQFGRNLGLGKLLPKRLRNMLSRR